MAKAIMIQGTASNAGKSLLAAGLCRIFSQDGHRVAPFKSQNMALNSYVTAAGLEMGRAQVMQAECAGVAPDVRMNPILLKPTSDSGSQVIVNGEVLGTMQAQDYYRRKSKLSGPVQAAYASLASEYDIIVLEGAGSPAEINLKDRDIVNMGMARMAGAPVLLAGDIDRGGVFASLAGTHLLLEPWERRLLKGVIINKFRGDVGLLEPGLRMLEGIIGKPVLGVVPYLRLDVDDEDSLSDRFEHSGGGLLDIAVLRLPHISNFTDFNALSAIDGVTVRYVDRADRLGAPDLLIVPGTKSSIADLKWLRSAGLEEVLLGYASRGGPVIGICGGYQMLGRSIRDPHAAEGGGQIAGIGLLPVDTVFAPRKHRRQVKGRFAQVEGIFSGLTGKEWTGYEIHMGETCLYGEGRPLLEIALPGSNAADGVARGDVYGCYIHGLFDRPEVAGAIVAALARRKGLPENGFSPVDALRHRMEQYDLLADHLRNSLDLEAVYRIVDQGI